MRTLGLFVCVFLVANHAIACQLPPVPKTPAAVDELVLVRPFTLAKGYQYNWSKDRPIVASGTLVVLKVDPNLVVPRNSPVPVLYAGNTTVQRLNHGHESGHVIAIIPGEIDLTKAPIWFGRPALPERVTAQMILSERALADAARIRPFEANTVERVTQERLQEPDLFSLLRNHVAKIVLEFSPEEKALAETWASQLPLVPKTPAKVNELVLARPFTLAKGYKHNWSKDRPIVTSGTLVVLKVDPALVFPRNSLQPVLYAGNTTVQRLNHGHESGHVIAIIPGEIDLTKALIWFGSPELPERITAQMIRSERARAEEAKIQPFAEKKVEDVTQERLKTSDLSSLLRDHIANLVLEFSPQEKELAEKWRLPVARARPKPR